MMKFKQWFEQKYGVYPGRVGEPNAVVDVRLANAVAEYVDEQVSKMRAELHETLLRQGFPVEDA